jgi:hypothetical protein
MSEQFFTSWDPANQGTSVSQSVAALNLALYLLLGGGLALYLRALYRFCSPSASDADSIARVFPLLTLVTIGVIAVVKSSLALSLGLVGALSIVRFRAAIKDPEELVFLFLCIGVGLSLGAQQPLLAIVQVAAATLFLLGMHFTGSGAGRQNLLLTITGEASDPMQDENTGVLAVLEELAGPCRLQRLDVEDGRLQARVVLSRSSLGETNALVKLLRQRLPECEFSYVNLNSLL